MIWLVVNPAAGSGRARAAGERLYSHVQRGPQSRGKARLWLTQGPSHATEIAREAEQSGVDTVVAVGGDGTIQEVVTGLCRDGQGRTRRARTRLALLPAGTGGDYRRSHALGPSVEEAAARLEGGQVRLVDVGHASVTTGKGSSSEYCFINVLSFGLGGLTDQFVAQGPKWLGGRTAFFLGAARATLVHERVPIELILDGTPLPIASYSNVAICLGRYFGGGMMIAPQASLDDGLFDIVTLQGSRIQNLSLAGSVYRGGHLGRPGVAHYRARRVEARVTRSGVSLVDLDGEQPGQLPLLAVVEERALAIVV